MKKIVTVIVALIVLTGPTYGAAYNNYQQLLEENEDQMVTGAYVMPSGGHQGVLIYDPYTGSWQHGDESPVEEERVYNEIYPSYP